jgi:hypothetical protein
MVDFILEELEQSEAAALHVAILRRLGYTTHLVEGLAIGRGQLDHKSRRLEVYKFANPWARQAIVAHELRHAWHHDSGVLDLLERVEPEQYLLATLVMEADAMAFEAHVAAQMASVGDPYRWNHYMSRAESGPGSDAYGAAISDGLSPWVASNWAFNEVMNDPKFINEYRRVAEVDAPALDVEPDPHAFERLAAIIRENSPTGQPYDDAIFEAAVGAARKATHGIVIDRNSAASLALTRI